MQLVKKQNQKQTFFPPETLLYPKLSPDFKKALLKALMEFIL